MCTIRIRRSSLAWYFESPAAYRAVETSTTVGQRGNIALARLLSKALTSSRCGLVTSGWGQTEFS